MVKIEETNFEINMEYNNFNYYLTITDKKTFDIYRSSNFTNEFVKDIIVTNSTMTEKDFERSKQYISFDNFIDYMREFINLYESNNVIIKLFDKKNKIIINFDFHKCFGCTSLYYEFDLGFWYMKTQIPIDEILYLTDEIIDNITKLKEMLDDTNIYDMTDKTDEIYTISKKLKNIFK